MASWSRRKTGGAVIQFIDVNGKRHTVGMGTASDRTVERAVRVVEDLVNAAKFSQPLPADAVAWVNALPETAYARFVAAGLALPRQQSKHVTVSDFASTYFAKRTDVKGSTRLVHRNVVRNLTDYFKSTPLSKVTAGDADDFARWLATEGRSDRQNTQGEAGLAPATCGKRLQLAATMFEDARKRKLISDNPFSDVRKPATTNPGRKKYVPVEHVLKLIEHETDAEWRALLALARYLGLRTPSEPFSLTWDCVDWTTRRLRIISPKTDRGGRPSRIAPILPEVWPFLEALRSISPNDEGYVFHRLRQRESVRATERGFWGGVNLRTELLKKLGRQGLEPWPKLWHALRASAETDLVSQFPVHVVAAWLGNSPAVAAKHYLMVTDADFERASFGRTPQTALQSALQSPAERGGQEQSTVPENAENPVNHGVSASPGGRSGTRTPTPCGTRS